MPYTSTARVLLSGLGSDELLGGYGRHRSAFSSGGWPAVIEEVCRWILTRTSLDDPPSYSLRLIAYHQETSEGMTVLYLRMVRRHGILFSLSMLYHSWRSFPYTTRWSHGWRLVWGTKCCWDWLWEKLASSWRALGGSGRCNLAVIPQEWRESVERMATNRLDCLPLCNDISIMLPERCWFLFGRTLFQHSFPWTWHGTRSQCWQIYRCGFLSFILGLDLKSV